MRRLWFAALALLVMPVAASAQSIRVAAGGAAAEFNAAGAVPSYPVAALTALGAQVAAADGGFQVVLLGDTIRFWTGSPFFTTRGAVAQLIHPVRRDTDGFRVPTQFFTEWLPTAYRGRITLEGGELTNREAPAPPAVIPAGTRRPAERGGRMQRVVILDPGHGGPDPGKIGLNGIREKDAVLRLASAIEAILEERDYEVHLTRSRDTLIALADRPHIANRLKNGRPSSIFVSLHYNSFQQRSVRGFETFFLSDARTEDERRVAEMENAAIAFESGPAAPLPTEQAILAGLRNEFYVRASSDLADGMQRAIATVHAGPDRGVKRAGFRVLIGALMPAVLIEAGFISNPGEAEDIASTGFRNRVARAIADAIERFFVEHEHLWEGAS